MGDRLEHQWNYKVKTIESKITAQCQTENTGEAEQKENQQNGMHYKIEWVAINC